MKMDRTGTGMSGAFGWMASFLLVFMASSASYADNKATARYAVVDMQSVILNVNEGKEARAKLEKEIKEKEAELTKSKEELDKMNNEWKTQAPLLSEAARLKKQQEFQEKFVELRTREMDFQKEIKGKEQMATQKIAVAVTKLVNELAKSRGYEMVFETSSAGLLYLKDPYDLTKEVTDAYEAQSKKEKGNPTPAPSPKKK